MAESFSARVILILVGALLVSLTVPARNQDVGPEAATTEILSVSSDSLPGAFPGILAFDVSPDGSMLAIEFIAADQDKNQVLEICEWNLASKLRTMLTVVEGPAKDLLSNRRFDLRFSPNGRDLIALTGARVLILDSDRLSPLHVIGLPSESVSATKSEWVLDNFGISADGSKLAVISHGTGFMCGDHSTFRFFDLASADLLHTWRFSGCAAGLSLSDNGMHVIFGTGELLDTATGGMVRNFIGGGGVFVDGTRFIRPASFSGKGLPALEIVNILSGQVEYQMHYSTYGLSGRFAVAPAAGVIAVMDVWLNPRDLARDATYARGFTRLVMFHVKDEQPFYASADIHDRPNSSSEYIVRLSADGREAAYGGSSVHVVKIGR